MEDALLELEIREKRRIARKNEKEGICRIGNALGLAYGAVLLISYGWKEILAVILGIFGISRNYLDNILSDPAISCFVQIILSISFFILPFSAVMKWGGFKTAELLPFSKPKKGSFLPLTLIGIGTASFSNIANSISGMILIWLGFPDKYAVSVYPEGIFGVTLTVISTALIPAFVEEFGMRGVCLGSLRRYGDGFAIIVSSVLFGLIHGNFGQIFFAAIIGLAAGYATVKSGSMWPAIIIHFVNNLISVGVHYFSEWFGPTPVNIVYLFVLCFNMLLGILGIFLLSRREKETLETEENKTVATTKDKLVWFFTSPIIIICIILTLAEAIFLR